MSNRQSIPPLPTSRDAALETMARKVAALDEKVRSLEARHGLPADLRVSLNDDGEVVVTRVTTGNTATITPPL